ncbi:MAG: hypothetical protein J5775_05715 [Spirochaetales bacterium]|nr:hypothetical protein [Spirochaetales bacterium]
MLKNELLQRKKTLEGYIRTIERWLPSSPDGSLWISTQSYGDKKRIRFFLYRQKELFPAKDMSLIKALAEKDYRMHLLKAIRKELSGIDRMLKVCEIVPSTYGKLHTGRKELVSPFETPVSDRIRRFLEEPEVPSDYEIKYPNNTMKGDIVRSWQEAMIADELYLAKIPYRYEKPFRLFNGHVVRPDFTMMHPATGVILIWEHFGRTDKQTYMSETISKIKNYAKTGMVLGSGLIATFDNDEFKLTREEIRQIIQTHLR